MKISRFIDKNKTWDIKKLNEILPKFIMDKIINIPVQLNDIKDRVVSKVTFDEKFSVRTIVWISNDEIPLYPRAKLLEHI